MICGAGLAAPQVHVSQQIVVFEVDQNPRYPDADQIPLTVLINPKITPLTLHTDEDWEGCLSVDGLRGKVTRPSLVRVQALDRDGKAMDFEATGLYAVCIQHEMDHLIGKVFLDRMTNLSTLTQLDEFTAYWHKEPTTVI